MTTLDRPIRKVIARCREGFSSPELPTEVVDLLGDAVAFDKACWGRTDPVTLWPTANDASPPEDKVVARAWEMELSTPDVLKFSDLARRADPVGVLSSTLDGDMAASPRFGAVLQPLGVFDELRAALSFNGMSWGWLTLFRRGPEPFDRDDAARVATLVPHFARAISRAALSSAPGVPQLPEPPGIIVLGQHDSILSMTAQTRDLLDELLPGTRGSVAGIIRSLSMAARGRPDRHDATGETDDDRNPPTRALIAGRSGRWLVLAASRLLGDDQHVAVTIQTAPRTELGPVLLGAYDLTRREAEVASAALRGDSTKEIAATLFLSTWTVQDHLKAIFAKTGVRSRRELTVQLFSER